MKTGCSAKLAKTIAKHKKSRMKMMTARPAMGRFSSQMTIELASQLNALVMHVENYCRLCHLRENPFAVECDKAKALLAEFKKNQKDVVDLYPLCPDCGRTLRTCNCE